MHYFSYKNNKLFCEGVAVKRIAQKVGTPFYCYSYRTFTEHFLKLKKAFASVKPLICFSMKANSNAALLRGLVTKGAGLDIVSGGELYRGLRTGCSPRKIVYAGVGKTEQELRDAIRKRILLFNVESEPELQAISRVSASLRKTTKVSIRINPDVDAETHAYITTAKAENKFGINLKQAEELCLRKQRFPHVVIAGLHIHIGSQIVTSKPFVRAITRALTFMDRLKQKGVCFEFLNIGGGLGIVYKDEKPQTAAAFAKRIVPLIAHRGYKIILEPGRFIAGNSGIFVTRIIYIKHACKKNFFIVDGAMNDLVRPSLYGAYHEIGPVIRSKGRPHKRYDVVGPICESGDFLGKDRSLPVMYPGELLTCFSAGAYGFTMSSNYNSRPRVPEVLVKGTQFAVVRKRELYADLIKGESIPQFIR